MDLHVPNGGSLVELAYEGVSSKFSCFLILSRTNTALLVTSPLCAKKNNNGTLFKLLAYTCWRHLVNGAKRETILSEKGLSSLIKHEPLQYLIHWTCSCPNSSLQSYKNLVLLRAPGDLDRATSVTVFSERNSTKSVWSESDIVLLRQLVRNVFESNFCYFLWLQHLNSTAPEKVPEFDLRDILW